LLLLNAAVAVKALVKYSRSSAIYSDAYAMLLLVLVAGLVKSCRDVGAAPQKNMHSATEARGDASKRAAASTSSETSAATAVSAQWDCTSCNAALQDVLRRDRPSRLMQAVQAGMLANNTAAQEQPAAYNDFDCGTTVNKHLHLGAAVPSFLLLTACIHASCFALCHLCCCRFRQCARFALAQGLEQEHELTLW
jgi:hypothetical protein